MAVASHGAALSALRSLINHDPVPAGTVLHRPYLPDGIEPADDGVLLTPAGPIGGYGDEARYALRGDRATQLAIAGPPAAVLADAPQITSRLVRDYVGSSIDLTMQGGTTSGVVYPLAVCDLATAFRFRNVGGASAGAIAAALTAAAELGRSEGIRQSVPEPVEELASSVPEPVEAPSGEPAMDPPTSSGHERSASSAHAGIRRGFVGLTDVVAWLTQIGPGDPERDEYRLAQLFRAPDSTRDVFRLLIAVIRQRTWSLPVVAWSAFGWRTWLTAYLIGAATVVGTGWVCSRFVGRDFTWYGTIGWGLLGTLSFIATLVGLVLLVHGLLLIGQARRTSPPGPSWVARLNLVSSESQPPPTAPLPLVLVGAGLAAAGVLVLVVQPAPYWAGWLVGLSGTLSVLAVLLVSAVLLVGRMREVSYGLVAGSSPRRPRNLLDLMAGVPRPTVEASVTPWLASSLNRLAGLAEGEVMRFGHLWAGLDYSELRRSPDPERRARLQDLAADPDLRLVNLELMTTDITRQRPYRFPLPEIADDDPERLWLDLATLRDGAGSGVVDDRILDVLGEGNARRVRDRAGVVRTLHPLPDPWDLPVIFAVRISMALPGLFQAVRMYRIVPITAAYDDFGRRLSGAGLPDVSDRTGEPDELVAEELWFSDGGITSNFPVHFFDSPLPRWPTVSLNLGQHPDLAPHQDVSLPQDWDADATPVEPLTKSGFSLVAGVFFTAMKWRDNMQSAMPGYRNRIAQVRTRPNEGGTNLFMARELIASMAVRGALAGARLRTRFADESQWNRFRWLRLRIAVGDIEQLRALTGERRGFYADAFSGPAWLDEQQRTFTERPAAGEVPWYRPVDGFWPQASDLLADLVAGYLPEPGRPNVMTTGVPEPEPELRQVPRE